MHDCIYKNLDVKIHPHWRFTHIEDSPTLKGVLCYCASFSDDVYKTHKYLTECHGVYVALRELVVLWSSAVFSFFSDHWNTSLTKCTRNIIHDILGNYQAHTRDSMILHIATATIAVINFCNYFCNYQRSLQPNQTISRLCMTVTIECQQTLRRGLVSTYTAIRQGTFLNCARG